MSGDVRSSPGSQLRVRLSVADVYEKGSNQFAVIAAEFSDERGELIQSQETTFIERKAT